MRARWVGRGRRVLGRSVLAMAAFVGGAMAVGAQEEVRPELRGEVRRGEELFPGAEVILHRVSAVTAGEIDTVFTDPGGLFRFELPSVPREDQEGDIYFASVRHEGILYFGSAVSRAVQLDSLYTLQTYDTAVAPVGGAVLPVSVRYLIAEESPTGWRITDLFEITHEGDRTWVPAPDGGLTWSHPLPAGIRDPQVGGGDVSSDAAQVADARLSLSGPISPGVRQFVLRYEVDALDGLDIPLEPGTGTVEFMVREPAPALEVEGIPAVETVEMQPGVTFRRYAGDAPPGGRLLVQAGSPPARIPVEFVAVGLAFLLAALGLFAVMRRPGGEPAGGGVSPRAVPSPAAPDPAEDRERLLLEVARIDQQLDDPGLDDDRRAHLADRRAVLVARLAHRS